MSAYTRVTQPIRVEDVPAAMGAALAAYEELHQLPSILAGARHLVCTTSTQKAGFFGRLLGREQAQIAVALVTDEHLVIVTSDKGGAPTVHALVLSGAEISDYERSPFAQRIPDTGLQITAFSLGGAERRSSFVGLGPGAAADGLRSVLGRRPA